MEGSTYRPDLELPQLEVGIDLSIVVWPGVVDVDAPLQLEFGTRELLAEVDADFWFHLVVELGSDLNASPDH